MRDANHSSLRCLLDDDADAVRAARTRRFRSVAVSVSLQALFITVVVVAPLLATGKLQLHTQPPVIIFRGRPEPYRSEARPAGPLTATSHSGPTFVRTIVQPAWIPTTIGEPNEGPPEVGRTASGGCLGCQETGLIDPPPGLLGSVRGPKPPLPDPTPPSQQHRQRVGGDIQQAKLIRQIAPVYPALCKQIKLEGELTLRAVVARDGSVQELTYVSGPACFLQSAMDAVAQWRYSPTLLNGQTVEVETVVRVIYRMNR